MNNNKKKVLPHIHTISAASHQVLPCVWIVLLLWLLAFLLEKSLHLAPQKEGESGIAQAHHRAVYGASGLLLLLK